MLSLVLGELTCHVLAIFSVTNQLAVIERGWKLRTGYSHVMAAYIHCCTQFKFKHLQKQEVVF